MICFPATQGRDHGPGTADVQSVQYDIVRAPPKSTCWCAPSGPDLNYSFGCCGEERAARWLLVIAQRFCCCLTEQYSFALDASRAWHVCCYVAETAPLTLRVAQILLVLAGWCVGWWRHRDCKGSCCRSPPAACPLKPRCRGGVGRLCVAGRHRWSSAFAQPCGSRHLQGTAAGTRAGGSLWRCAPADA